MDPRARFPLLAAAAGALLLACGTATEPPAGADGPPPDAPGIAFGVSDGVLPGWAMIFIDLELDRSLELDVSQADPVACDPDDSASGPFGPAQGGGEVVAGGLAGSLTVREACFLDWPEEKDFPESAVVRGRAALATGRTEPFRAALISGFFGEQQELIEAIIGVAQGGECEELDRFDLVALQVDGVDAVVVCGELHHIRKEETPVD